jgi:hypothetical protein
VAIYRDEGISGTRGRDKRPGLDALLKGVASGQMWIANRALNSRSPIK